MRGLITAGVQLRASENPIMNTTLVVVVCSFVIVLLLGNKYPTFSMMPSFVVRRLWVDLFGLPGRPMTVEDLLHVSPNPIDP